MFFFCRGKKVCFSANELFFVSLLQSIANQQTSSGNHKKEAEKLRQESFSQQNKLQLEQAELSNQYAKMGVHNPHMFLSFLEQFHRMPAAMSMHPLGPNAKGKFESPMMPPCTLPNWVAASATAQLAQISANVGSKSPPPPKSPTPEETDAPLNLTKPKNVRAKLPPMEQPLPSGTPKLMPPNLMMPRGFMPYAGIPHLSPLSAQKQLHASPKDGLPSPDKHSHFPMPMYMSGPPPHHLAGPKGHHQQRDEPPVGKDDDFMSSKCFLLLRSFEVS